MTTEPNTVESQPIAGARPPSQGAAPLPDDALIIIPVRNLVMFPGLVMPITIGRETTVAAVQEAARTGRQVGIVLQRDPSVTEPGKDDLYPVGTTASILRYMTTPDGSHHVICQGEQRFRLNELLSGYPYYVGRVERMESAPVIDAEIEALMLQLKARAAEVLTLLPQAPAELGVSLQNITAPDALADWIVGMMDAKPAEKQEVLETFELRARMEKALSLLSHRLEVLRISQDIDERTKSRFAERQREAVLREQLKTIQQQLGDDEEAPAEVAQLEEAIDKAAMPAEVETHARKELKRLARMPEAAGEYSMLLTYMEWLTELPWSAATEDRIDIGEARRILDEDHYGLEKIKRRILEYLAVRKLNPNGKSPILCFAGPPGVGKTSLGQSIAKATGRKFVRVSLGGVHDESEIRGHRRTYVGALPGNIIQGMRKAGSSNCVMMLDEVDKLGSGVHGDPAAALLEVLDPEQNATFRDNYLGVPFDLSKVMFICTANMLETISGPLRDRMEIIQLPGYTEMEKAQIARRYLIGRQMEANGLKPEQCEITDAALHALIQRYTREAGVRGLEREVGGVLRSAAMRIAEGSAQQVKIDEPDLEAILGPARFENEVAMRASMPGVATGLAWTPVGGDILFIEATRTPGGGRLVLTGQLGDVMKESAQAALSLLKTRAESLRIDPALFEKSDIHIHVPAGATPKDGPSAGVAMFSALASLMSNRALRHDCAMTGEISLRGLVLPVGGIKEKVLAALRAGITTVLLPARNRKDVEDVPEDARRQLTFVFLDTVDDAMRTLMPLHPVAPEVTESLQSY
ncbi:ATP-dependent Lon protease [Noviherbaspirillum humi]|uniref:Lon protease n=1 Tax=Noviherbaspirillum humi TaxID=1688639 RepID=A0A239KJW4_9BURK|nr:endopeptidase La [Noviherbaspirillum humi]SNT18355.1 ATP-dependent Lon protease [Noviherbaspirillum humi]